MYEPCFMKGGGGSMHLQNSFHLGQAAQLAQADLHGNVLLIVTFLLVNLYPMIQTLSYKLHFISPCDDLLSIMPLGDALSPLLREHDLCVLDFIFIAKCQ